MNKNLQKLKGFTLLEVLIATAIFATVMVFTSGIITQSSSYQNRLQASQKVNEDSRSLADIIGKDLRRASEPFTAQLILADPKSYEFQNGIALLLCNTSGNWSCQFVYSDFATTYPGPVKFSDDTSSYGANAVVISTQDDFIFYISANKKVYSKAFPKAPLYLSYWDGATLKIQPSGTSIFGNNVAKDVNIISGAGVESSINFAGFTASQRLAPSQEGSYLQTYIGYYIHTRTAGFDTLSPYDRAETFIRSSITSRNYSI